MEISSSHGPGLWYVNLTHCEVVLMSRALREGGDGDKNMRLVHTSRSGLELSKRLFEDRAVDSEVVLEEEEDGELPSGNLSYERKITSNQQDKVCPMFMVLQSPFRTGLASRFPHRSSLHLRGRPFRPYTNPQTALAISSFYLSTLPTISSRQVHLRQLLASSPEYLILVDRSSPQGWQAISEARSYILSLSTPENPLHIIAPCPHEYECPLAGGRDRCSFSQKLQRPDFTRKTKHTNRGEEDVNYTYLVFGRGPRPVSSGTGAGGGNGEGFTQVGRMGGVGKEVMEKEAVKREGKSELREVEGGGGEFEMVSLKDLHMASGSKGEVDRNEDDVENDLREEAYTWPRVVAPPMKRAGHVILDTCFPDGKSSLSLPPLAWLGKWLTKQETSRD
jgi:hypothetical protein